MKQLPLSQGLYATVDDADFERAAEHKWYTHRLRGKVYVHSNFLVAGKRATVSLQRFILQAAPGQIVDHVNGDTLNNQRSNLRFCTRSQNKQNAQPHRNRGSQYKGVHYQWRGASHWSARITVDGLRRTIGHFKTEEQAARAYDAAARNAFGAFAFTNFSLDVTEIPA